MEDYRKFCVFHEQLLECFSKAGPRFFDELHAKSQLCIENEKTRNMIVDFVCWGVVLSVFGRDTSYTWVKAGRGFVCVSCDDGAAISLTMNGNDEDFCDHKDLQHALLMTSRFQNLSEEKNCARWFGREDCLKGVPLYSLWQTCADIRLLACVLEAWVTEQRLHEEINTGAWMSSARKKM